MRSGHVGADEAEGRDVKALQERIRYRRHESCVSSFGSARMSFSHRSNSVSECASEYITSVGNSERQFVPSRSVY